MNDERSSRVQSRAVREACFIALRDALPSALTAKEVTAILEPLIGVEVERRGEIHRYLAYGDVFKALQALQRADAIESQKIHTSRLWWARG